MIQHVQINQIYFNCLLQKIDRKLGRLLQGQNEILYFGMQNSWQFMETDAHSGFSVQTESKKLSILLWVYVAGKLPTIRIDHTSRI